MKLIKLSEDYYIGVDDSEIKEGDFVYSSDGGIFKRHIDNPCQTVFSISKITHSTQPIEYEVVDVTPTGDAIEGYVYDKIQELSLSEVKELLGVVDVLWSRKFEYLKKVNENIKHKSQDEKIWIFGASDLGFIAGYNQALEDNKDKKYTEEDIRKALSWGYHTAKDEEKGIRSSGYGTRFIQSLQPKTEWDVEIVDGKLKLKQ